MDPQSFAGIHQPELSPWLTFAVKIIAVIVAVRWATLLLRGSKQRDEREPPVVEPNIPIVGHVLGLVQYGNLYLAKVL